MTTLIDLGWQNAGGETAEIIDEYLAKCSLQAHRRVETNEGVNGTMHTVSCNQCGYAYHYDSGD